MTMNVPYKYKEICQLMNDTAIQGGKNRQNQLDSWKQFYDIEKIDTKYYIKKQYNADELQIVENQGKYTTYIENLLIENLYQFKNNEKKYIILTNRDILEMACMVNGKYFEGKNHTYNFINSFNYNINKGDIPDDTYTFNKISDDANLFFSASYRLLKRIIYDSLKSMEKRSLIILNKTYRLYKNYQTESGIWQQEQHECDDNDINRILTVQRRAIEIFNDEAEKWDNGEYKYYIKDLQNISVLYKPQKDEFFKILNNELKQEFEVEGYNAYSNAWRLNLASQESFNYAIKKINYSQLNKNVQNKLLTAKDLSIISDTLKTQMINKFIKL